MAQEDSEMSQLIASQTFDFVVLFFSGIIVAVLRDIYHFVQNRYKPNKGISFLQEMLFWMLCAGLVSSGLYYCAFGALSLHALAGFTMGTVVWYNIWHVYR